MSGKVTKQQQKRKRQRQKARKHILHLLTQQGGTCHWCPKPLACWQSPPPNVIHRSDTTVVCSLPGGEKTYWWASIDHVKPLSEGGSNKIDNLVAACKPCNSSRSTVKVIPLWQGAEKCRKCGKEKNPGYKKCSACRAVDQEMMRLGKLYHLRGDASPCNRCNEPVVAIGDVPGIGPMYGCPRCSQTRIAERKGKSCPKTPSGGSPDGTPTKILTTPTTIPPITPSEMPPSESATG